MTFVSIHSIVYQGKRASQTKGHKKTRVKTLWPEGEIMKKKIE